MDTFTALDFETAKGYRNSICQVGLVRMENGIIVKEINILVQPPDNYYWNVLRTFTELPRKTLPMLYFRQVWCQIAPYIENQNVIAHNGFGFDFPVLDKTLEIL